MLSASVHDTETIYNVIRFNKMYEPYKQLCVSACSIGLLHMCDWKLHATYGASHFIAKQRANLMNPNTHSFKTLNEVKNMTHLPWAKDHWAGGMCVQQFVAWSIYDCDYDTRILIHIVWPEHSHRKLSGMAKLPKPAGCKLCPNEQITLKRVFKSECSFNFALNCKNNDLIVIFQSICYNNHKS